MHVEEGHYYGRVTGSRSSLVQVGLPMFELSAEEAASRGVDIGTTFYVKATAAQFAQLQSMVYELSSLDCHYLPANLATGVVNVLDLPFYSDITVHALEMQLRFARADTIACAPNHGALPHWIECEIALVQRELERRRQHERRTAGFMFV